MPSLAEMREQFSTRTKEKREREDQEADERRAEQIKELNKDLTEGTPGCYGFYTERSMTCRKCTHGSDCNERKEALARINAGVESKPKPDCFFVGINRTLKKNKLRCARCYYKVPCLAVQKQRQARKRVEFIESKRRETEARKGAREVEVEEEKTEEKDHDGLTAEARKLGWRKLDMMYFENTKGDHNKFWMAIVTGNTLYRAWGKIGSWGTTKIEHLPGRHAHVKFVELCDAKEYSKHYDRLGTKPIHIRPKADGKTFLWRNP